jgi:hypothetical protein
MAVCVKKKNFEKGRQTPDNVEVFHRVPSTVSRPPPKVWNSDD